RPPGKGAALSPTWARSAFWPDGALRRHCCKHRWPLLLASVGRAAGGKRPRRPNPLSEEALDAGGCPRLRDEDEEAAGGGGGERREAALPPPCMGRHVAGAGTTPRLGELPPSGSARALRGGPSLAADAGTGMLG
ncbi:unnamed protein product, partial [Prorocentrum cordatum]